MRVDAPKLAAGLVERPAPRPTVLIRLRPPSPRSLMPRSSQRPGAPQRTVPAGRQAVAAGHGLACRHRPAIDVVTGLARVRPGQGFAVLRTVSQHTNRKLRDVAEQIVTGPSAGQLGQEISEALTATLSAEQ